MDHLVRTARRAGNSGEAAENLREIRIQSSEQGGAEGAPCTSGESAGEALRFAVHLRAHLRNAGRQGTNLDLATRSVRAAGCLYAQFAAGPEYVLQVCEERAEV